MCLILFAVKPNPKYRLVVAANRDEFYSRPAYPARLWNDHPEILAGRDAEMGGTWLGVNRQGKFAAVTNYRETPPVKIPPRSRGELPLRYLAGNKDASAYAASIVPKANDYRGFNLLAADDFSVQYLCNRTGETKTLINGYYGLSNQVLNCSWPKVSLGRKQLKQSLDNIEDELSERLFDILMDSGDGREFSNSFISGEEYGTRAMTVVLIGRDGDIYFEERTFGVNGKAIGNESFSINHTDDF